ncbi:hypothetical protein ACPUYX_00890 [Desulfosporosinus sp. SYSU MS00001]|uniref:hypothetical protein n=1 Tax=Desulfosporosinus sp. SYSU MS00001 TaxID=3416284 RepID=UPI003CEB3197
MIKIKEKLQEEDKKHFLSEITSINFGRSSILALALLIVSFLLLITDYYNYKNGLWMAEHGYRYLFYCHLLLFSGILLLMPFLLLSRSQNPNHLRWSRAYVLLLSYLVTLDCSLTSISDQMINGEMTVYIMGIIIFAIINYSSPLSNFLLNFCASAAFLIGIKLVQTDLDILKSQ